MKTIICFAMLISTAAPAQCRTSCLPDEVRDGSGCCVTAAPTGTASPAGCPAGQELGADTAGHCCWPGQGWNGKACIGLPTRCPAGLQVRPKEQDCAAPPCNEGRVRVGDAKCCFAEQMWSTARNQCIGVPVCPKGLEVRGETCVPELAPLVATAKRLISINRSAANTKRGLGCRGETFIRTKSVAVDACVLSVEVSTFLDQDVEPHGSTACWDSINFNTSVRLNDLESVWCGCAEDSGLAYCRLKAEAFVPAISCDQTTELGLALQSLAVSCGGERPTLYVPKPAGRLPTNPAR